MIVFSSLQIRRGVRVLLDNATATINPGQKVGLVGKNGCGKSTLLALLKNEISADGGSYTFPGSWQLAWVNQETPALPQAALEYVIDGDREYRQLEAQLHDANERNDGHAIATIHGKLDAIDAWSIRSRAASLLHGLGFSNEQLERPVSDFSGGWRMRLNLAQALICRSDLLLLDEPTNHLDRSTAHVKEAHARCPINGDDVNGQTPLHSGGSLAHDKVDIPSEWWRAQSDSDPSGSVGSILGSDSHTRYGALGTMAVGEGGGELVKQLLNDTWDIDYPGVVAVHLTGKPAPYVGPQDVALAIIGAVFKNGYVKNKVMEFVGPGVSALSTDFRNSVDVMTTETTCLSSVWQTDEEVHNWLALHGRGQDYCQLNPQPMAYYDGCISVDLSAIKPMIALPFHPSNVYEIDTLNQNLTDILREIEIASIIY